jgi:hypothetical protein
MNSRRFTRSPRRRGREGFRISNWPGSVRSYLVGYSERRCFTNCGHVLRAGGERKKRPRRGRGQLPPFRVFELCGRLPLSFRLPKQFRTAGNRSPSPITITARRAEGSGVACEFHSTQRESSNVWRLRAECASQTERWNANIRLTVSTSKLTWSSERGVTTYVRCPTTSASR